jgi:hypothetical protein
MHCHTRAGGCPVRVTLDSRLRGNDSEYDLRKVSCFIAIIDNDKVFC